MRRARPDHETDGRRKQSQRDGDQRARSEADTTVREQPLAALHRTGGNQAVQSAVDNERVARSGAGSRVPDTTPETDRNTRKTDTQTTEGETETPGAQTPSRRESALERAIQPKLEVSNPTDRYEREADRVAAAVMRSENETQPRAADPEPTLQRMCTRCRRRLQRGKPLDCEVCEAQLQRAIDASGGHTIDDDSEVARQVRQARSGGRRLPAETRSFFESRMDQDFGDVRVHTDSQADRAARSVNARAFTLGSDVVFRSGEYRPNSRSGKRLLAHELTHVVQQGGGRRAARSPVSEDESGDAAGETTPGVDVSRRDAEGIQRWRFGEMDIFKHDPVADDYFEVPDEDRSRVRAALNIVERIVNNRDQYRRCHEAFGGSLGAIYERMRVWKEPPGEGERGELLGSHTSYDRNMFGLMDVAYTDYGYRLGKWTIAATLVHEMAHIANIKHDSTPDNEQVVGWCGLPTVEDINEGQAADQAKSEVGEATEDATGAAEEAAESAPNVESVGETEIITF